MAIGDVVRLQLRARLHGQAVYNVLHFRYKTANASDQGLASTVAQAFANALRAHQSNELTWESAVARALVPARDAVAVPMPSGTIGEVLANSLPAVCAAVSKLGTGIPGRDRRGRLYLGGIPATVETDSRLDPAYVSALQATLAQLVATYGGGGSDPDYEWGIFSRKLGGFKDPFSSAGFQPIAYAVARDFVATFNLRKVTRGI